MTTEPPKHVVAAGILVECGDEVLLVRTERRGWEFPGGQIEHGESVIDGVVREVKEEANITARVNQLAGVYSNLSNHRVIFDFLGTRLSGDAKPSVETIDVAWIRKSDAATMIEHPGYSQRLQQLLSFDGRVLFQSYTTHPFVVLDQHFV